MQNKGSIFDIDKSEREAKYLLSEDSDSDSSSENLSKTLIKSNKHAILSEEEELEEEEKEKLNIAKSCDGSSLNKSENDSCQKTELFDFSNILKSQEEYTHLASKLKQSNNNSLKSKPQQITRKRKYKSVGNDNFESLEVSDLLRIGENDVESFDENSQEINETDNETIQSCNKENLELKSIEITIQEPNVFNQKRKTVDKRDAEFERLLNLKRKSDQLILHKVHLLCLIASGIYINNVVSLEELQAVALSIIPSKNYYPPEKTNRDYVVKLLEWFSRKVKRLTHELSETKNLLQDLIEDFGSFKPRSCKNLILLFLAIVRVLGVKSRLVINLCPVDMKPPVKSAVNNDKKEEDCKIKKSTKSKADVSRRKVLSSDEEDDDDLIIAPKNKKSAKSKANVSKRKKLSSDEEDDDRIKASTNKKSPKSKANVSKRKVLSTDEEDDDLVKASTKKNKKTNMWVEIYEEVKGTWISVDVARSKVDCHQELYDQCDKPVTYILAWNPDGTIKDVTKRYVPQWHICLKKRLSSAWWELTLSPWAPLPSLANEQEDSQLEKKVESMPFPKSIAEFKGHPHFALKRHLLKFEAIFPPTAVPLGQIKGECIYARVCVVELHTKESWLKEGKVVRPNQEPYKIVKARPKREKGTMKLIKDLPLNLFGYWQVEDYIPPTAVDGKVPRNDFGNVELYKPTMIPKGTVHLRLPGLMRIAKKLNIDCANAVTGWEFRGCGSHPVMDGVIVCEEFKQQLIDAWNEMFDNTAQKNENSVKIRVLSNWRKFVKGILLRDKLKEKYKFNFKTKKKNCEKNKSTVSKVKS